MAWYFTYFDRIYSGYARSGLRDGFAVFLVGIQAKLLARHYTKKVYISPFSLKSGTYLLFVS